MDDHSQWFANFRESDNYKRLQVRPVAYFSMEFALSEQFPFYAGGLGVLAADIVREAADQHIPMVGVGLFYRDLLKTQPEQAGLVRVADRFKNHLVVSVPIQDRRVMVGAYRWDGLLGVPVFFLTTDMDGNNPGDRSITEKLYPSDKERRLQQEMVLGIGGLRLLEALEYHPVVYHLNEGHSALLALEIIQHEMRERLIGFTDAVSMERPHVVFTNHTLVAAGQEVYSNDLVAVNLAKYAEEFAIPVQEIVKMGLVQESSLFSMTMLSLRLSSRVNAVSRVHAQKARDIWSDHPMVPITNGVHVATWDRLQAGRSWQDARGSQDHSDSGRVRQIISEFWEAHLANKRKLLSFIEKTTGKKWDERVLLLGWARRLVSYKRPLAIFANPGRFCAIARSSDRPVRLVMAGDIQQGDEESVKMHQELQRLATSELSDCVAFLPDYNTDVAHLLTAGCDVWLNTPIVGFEACGTSGMKAALNGVLPCSTNDGWVAEVNIPAIGWLLDSDHVSESIHKALEKEIVPMFFDSRRSDEWRSRMIGARQLVLAHFSSTRALREYLEHLYLPAVEVSFGHG